MPTLLARKNSIPIATDDDAHELMVADPSIKEFPQGSSWGQTQAQATYANQIQNYGNTQNIAQTFNTTPNLTEAAPTNAASGAEVLVEHTKESADWINKKWRPMMAVMYMVVCVFDFILFPVLFTIVQFWETQAANDAFRQWQPMTLMGAGLFHMAMGAVLGITAWSRGQEKMAGVANK